MKIVAKTKPARTMFASQKLNAIIIANATVKYARIHSVYLAHRTKTALFNPISSVQKANALPSLYHLQNAPRTQTASQVGSAARVIVPCVLRTHNVTRTSSAARENACQNHLLADSRALNGHSGEDLLPGVV